MKAKSITLCGAIITTGLVAGIIIHRHYSAGASPQPTAQRADKGAASSQTSPTERSPITPRAPQIPRKPPVAENSKANPQPEKLPASLPAKEPLQDPIARDALALVGFDPEAELYWFAAINDLSLPANERQDLIEDLNEEGLPDPKHPTPEDLPLILNRLALIEAVGPDAADEVNADAFVEAYKDLLNLAQLAMGGGEPVK